MFNEYLQGKEFWSLILFFLPVAMWSFIWPEYLFQVRVTNVMDKALGKMTVTATSAEDTEGTTVLSNKVFTAGPEE